jgi:prepilin-type N-terminal cleavage/methylation domain-containing protein
MKRVRQLTPASAKSRQSRLRRGLTLTELLVATTIMVMIAGAMATLAVTAHATNTHCRGQVQSSQHARVSLERIEQAMEKAVANEQFPACLVVAEQSGGQQLPQTLVVWSPTGSASDPIGLPLISELVVFSPDPANPSTLLEIRSPANTSTAPPTTDMSGWQSLVDSLRTSLTNDRIVLTNQLRTAPLSGTWSNSLTSTQLRGVVRFRRVLAPTEQSWTDYRAGTRAWQDLDWPLDGYRAISGTRVVVCQTELQIVMGNMGAAGSTALPFFGSTSLAYELQHDP